MPACKVFMEVFTYVVKYEPTCTHTHILSVKTDLNEENKALLQRQAKHTLQYGKRFSLLCGQLVVKFKCQ